MWEIFSPVLQAVATGLVTIIGASITFYLFWLKDMRAKMNLNTAITEAARVEAANSIVKLANAATAAARVVSEKAEETAKVLAEKTEEGTDKIAKVLNEHIAEDKEYHESFAKKLDSIIITLNNGNGNGKH